MRHEDKAWNETVTISRARTAYCRGDDYPMGDEISLPEGIKTYLSCEVQARIAAPPEKMDAYYGKMKLRGLTFVDCQNTNNALLRCSFDGVKIIGGSFAGNDVRACEFRDAKFETDMAGTAFRHCNLSGANLTGSKGAVTFQNCNLSYTAIDAQQAVESTFDGCRGTKNLVLVVGDKVVTDYAINTEGRIVALSEEAVAAPIRIARMFVNKAVGALEEVSLAQAYKTGLIVEPAAPSPETSAQPYLVAA